MSRGAPSVATASEHGVVHARRGHASAKSTASPLMSITVVPMASRAVVDDERLGQLDDVGYVTERLVRLHHRELGIVRGVHALVAERAPDLEHTVEATDDQALEVELGGDAQVQRHVEGVVVGDERAGVGAAGLDVEDRRLHLDEAALDSVVRKLVSTAWRISKTRRAVALTARSA